MKSWLLVTTLCATLCSTPSLASAAESPAAPHTHHRSLHPISADVQNTDTDADIHRWDIHSSVQVSRDTLRDAFVASRNAYTAKLQRYAKISAQQASRAISAEHPGMKVRELQLRNIRTSLVYMALAEDDEDRYLVIVDAGNGKILMDKPYPTHHTRVFSQHEHTTPSPQTDGSSLQ